MKREIIYISIIVLMISIYAQTVVMGSSSGPYYIQTSSPKYSILPDSIFVQSLQQNYTLPFAILLNFTHYGNLISKTYSIVGKNYNFISPNEFRNNYYPSNSYVESLVKYLQSYGINFTGNYGLILTFNGTVYQIEHAFNTYINIYYYPLKNIYWFGLVGITNVGPFYYFSNNITPSLPYSVGKYVLGIVGIDSIDPHIYSAFQQAWKVNMNSSSDSSLVSSVLVTPTVIANYFNFTELYASGHLGQGETIGIEGVPESFVNASDIYSFWKNFAIVQRTGGLNIITFGTDTSSGQSGENELDAEWSGVFAPASQVDVVFSDGYVGGTALVNNLLNYYYELYYMINYVNPDVISISVTLPESFLAAYYPAMLYMIHNIMIQAADEGISVLAASGDWGFESDYPPPNFIIGTYNTIWYPESDPFVTSVGGIFIKVNQNDSVVSISGWDYSTGGLSVVFPGQSYELTSLIPFTPPTPRTYPDIAFISAGGYNVPEFGFGLPLIYQGQLFVWYGTSGAAPMTAAMVALSGLRLGALNYILYHISYSGYILTPNGIIKGYKAWIPITIGANPTPAHYGWNFVTGPGTYNAYSMVNDLIIYSENI